LTLDTIPPAAATGWWPAIKHALLRVLLVVIAFFVAVLVTLIAVVIIYAVLSNLPAAPDYFVWFNWAPLLGIFAPFIAGFIYMLALIISAIPTLLTAILTEGLQLRQIWLHALLGMVVSGASFAIVTPTLIDGSVSASDLADVAIMAGGGLFGGLAYWLIAGRGAGIFLPRGG
jgi:hypothetical protein